MVDDPYLLHAGNKLLDGFDQLRRSVIELGDEPFQMFGRAIGHIQLDLRCLGDQARIAQGLGERLAHDCHAIAWNVGR